MWLRARRHLHNAKRIFCIGFGFPYTDLPMRFLLADAAVGRLSSCPFYLIDLNHQVAERVRSLLPTRFELSLDFFGADWNERLPDFLWGTLPSEAGETADPGLTQKLRNFVSETNAVGKVLKVQGSECATYRIEEISEYGVVVLDTSINVPIKLTWAALGHIVNQLSVKPPAPLPVCTPRPHPETPTVNDLLQPWYSRAVGPVAAALLCESGVANMRDDFMIEALTPRFLGS